MVNLAPFTDQTLISWLQEMTAHLRSLDVNRHLATNSYAIRDLSPIWSLPEMEIIQKHEYAHQVESANKDLAERAAADLARLAGSALARLLLLGESGYGTEGLGQGYRQNRDSPAHRDLGNNLRGLRGQRNVLVLGRLRGSVPLLASFPGAKPIP